MTNENQEKMMQTFARSNGMEVLFKNWIDEQIKNLNDVYTIDGTIEEKGRIVEARKEAIRILKKMFIFLYRDNPVTKEKTLYR
jgi:hypothetical protein